MFQPLRNTRCSRYCSACSGANSCGLPGTFRKFRADSHSRAIILGTAGFKRRGGRPALSRTGGRLRRSGGSPPPTPASRRSSLPARRAVCAWPHAIGSIAAGQQRCVVVVRGWLRAVLSCTLARRGPSWRKPCALRHRAELMAIVARVPVFHSRRAPMFRCGVARGRSAVPAVPLFRCSAVPANCAPPVAE